MIFAAVFAACPAEAGSRIAFVQEVAAPNGDSLATGLRLGFYTDGRDWSPICGPGDSKNGACPFDPNTATTWHVWYRGKSLGVLTAKGWRDPSLDASAGLLRIVSGDPPQVGERSKVFAGWVDRAVRRPLVATNANSPGIRARWHGSDPNSNDVARMLPLLTKRVPRIRDCRTDGEGTGPGIPMTVNDIRIVEVWSADNGGRLVSASVKPERVAKCDYTADLLADVWAFDDGKVLHPLAALSEDETTHAFLDSGDFANDGKEEVVFWLAGYNEDGFVLYYDNFSHSARLTWSYQ